jgi:Ras-related protein Rab-7L1
MKSRQIKTTNMKMMNRQFWAGIVLFFAIFISPSHARKNYKILVVGDVSVGKTSFIQRYVKEKFEHQYKATIGVDFIAKRVKQGDREFVLNFWDIAGQDRFASMMRVYYQNAQAAFVLFDTTQEETFEGAEYWKANIDAKVWRPFSQKPIPVILLATKTDLAKADSKDELHPAFSEGFLEKMKKACEEHDFRAWYGISSKDNTGIDQAMNKMIEILTSEGDDDYFVEQNQSSFISDRVKLDTNDKVLPGCDGCNG